MPDKTPPHKKQINSIDVAKAAGVSPATISRAFANRNINRKTREHILRIANELGYYPDALASGLNKGKNKLIAIIFDERNLNEWEFLMLDKLSTQLQNNGYFPLIHRLSSTSQYERVKSIAAWKTAGIIVFNDLLDASLLSKTFMTSSLIIVNTNFKAGNKISADHIIIDDHNGLKPLVDNLLLCGRKNFTWIGGTGVSIQRKKTISQILHKNKLSFIDSEQGDYSYDSGYMKSLLLCRRTPHIDTIMCANDSMALGAMDAIRHTLKLKVPEDIAITGYDDIPQASWPSYNLTTVRENTDEIISTVINFLLTRQKSPETPPRFYDLKSIYIPRTSSPAGNM